jgi:hypothetical protein
MLFNELGNFKYVMLFMLIPICNLWMNGFVAGAVWIGILVYVVPSVLAYLLDRYEVGHPNQDHSPRHHYRQGNIRPHFNHEGLIGGVMIGNELHQHLHDSPIAGFEMTTSSPYLSHQNMDADFWESDHNDFYSDSSSITTDNSDNWSDFHSLDSASSLFGHDEIIDNHGINPASGLPMMDSALDIHGNMYGTNSADDFINSHTWDSSFDHHTSFDSTNDFMHHADSSSSCMDSTCNTFGDNRY